MSRVLPEAGSAAARFLCSARRFGPFSRTAARVTGWLAVLSLLTASGCEVVGPGMFGPVAVGSGNIISKAREVEPFQEVRVAGSADVVHVMAAEAGCEIEADDNLEPLITTTVEDGVLKIEFKGSMQPTQGIKIRLAGAPLRGFTLAGSGTFTTEQVDAEQFEFSVAGAGDAKLSGQTKQLTASVSGSGKVLAAQLKAEQASIQISGAGSADLHVESSLKVNISGAGSVKYSGNPQVSQSISGAGSVQAVQRENPPAAKQEGTSE